MLFVHRPHEITFSFILFILTSLLSAFLSFHLLFLISFPLSLFPFLHSYVSFIYKFFMLHLFNSSVDSSMLFMLCLLHLLPSLLFSGRQRFCCWWVTSCRICISSKCSACIGETVTDFGVWNILFPVWQTVKLQSATPKIQRVCKLISIIKHSYYWK
jgi:hypothetical protein